MFTCSLKTHNIKNIILYTNHIYKSLEMKVNHWSLSNGATCVVTEMDNSSLTCIDFWCRAGSFYERAEEEGMAHFLEHMIFKGSKNLLEGEFDLKIESLGGSSNAATGLDDVHYHILIPPNKIKEAISLLLELISSPSINKDAFEIEKEVVLEEIAQSNDQPEEVIFTKLLENCWPNHRYGRPILGNKENLHKMTPMEMKLFHKDQYLGKNCTLSIAGEVPEGIRSIINNSELNSLGTATQEKDSNITPIFKKGYKKESIPRLESGRILKAWELAPAKEQLLILGAEIATTILSEGRTSHMVKRLREELQIVESIEMDLHILERGGLVLLEVCCPTENIRKVENEINKILLQSIQHVMSEIDLERAKQLVTNNIYYGIELSTQIAATIGAQALWGRHQPLLEPIQNIPYWTPNRLYKSIFPLLHPENCFTLISEPKI